MAHRFESGFTVGERSWHGLENNLTEAPRTPDEALVAAGLDWEVEAMPIEVPGLMEQPEWAENYRAIVRTDKNRVLSIVTDQYHPLQNRDVLRFFAPFVAEGCSFETAGSLRGGRRIWAQARIHVEGEVVPGDKVESFLVLASSHDRSLPVSVFFTDIRVVCDNTLGFAVSDAEKSTVRLLHRAGVEESLAAVQHTIDASRRKFDVSMEQYRAWRSKGLDVKGLRQYVKDVFKVEEKREPDKAPSMPLAWESIERLFESGPGSDLAGSTVWGAYNAITGWIDHERGRGPDTRLDASWFGAGRVLRNRAATLASRILT